MTWEVYLNVTSCFWLPSSSAALMLPLENTSGPLVDLNLTLTFTRTVKFAKPYVHKVFSIMNDHVRNTYRMIICTEKVY